MTKSNYSTPFAENLQKLIDRATEGNVSAWCKLHESKGLKQTRVNRLLTGEVCGQLDTVDQVSQATGFAPWQLLHPDFDPKHQPPMLDAQAMRVAAIFAGIKTEHDRRRARAIMEQFEDTIDAPQESPIPLRERTK